ncbi:hypothetical protein ACLMJK_003625 [Lecanora helva]
MERPMAQILEGLVPTIDGPIPQDLVELTNSLIAQSRSKASSLKTDEEIARSYACANIACERLKQTLALPKIRPRPPCPPKVYQRLYKYLDGVLSSGTRRIIRAKNVENPSSHSITAQPEPRTPTKATGARRNLRNTKAPDNSIKDDQSVPTWVMPAIRKLCERTSAPAAPNHIYAGVSSILAAQEKSQKHDLEISVPALLIAVFLLVTVRLVGVRTQPDEHARNRSAALRILNDSAAEVVDGMEIGDADVDRCTNQLRNEKWTQMDWFWNIPVGVGLGVPNESNDIADDDSSGTDEMEGKELLPVRIGSGSLEQESQEYLRAGLRTMMRNEVDYINDDRRHDYLKWKESILTQIDNS